MTNQMKFTVPPLRIVELGGGLRKPVWALDYRLARQVKATPMRRRRRHTRSR